MRTAPRENQPRRRPPLRGGGFTLIELLAVIVITAIIAAVAIPSLASAASPRNAHAARLILRDLTHARDRAAATGVRTWVIFNTAAGQCATLAENPASPGRPGAAPLLAPVSNAPLVRTLGVGEFTQVALLAADFDGAPEVGFDWAGAPLNAGGSPLAAPGRVDLTGNHRITVEPGSGLARLTTH